MDNKKRVRIRRLGWAGVEIECAGETLLIDYVLDISPLAVIHNPEEHFPASSQPSAASVALLTHLHSDHADAKALSVALRKDAPVFRPTAARGNDADMVLTTHTEMELKKYGLKTEIIGEWEERKIGPFRIFSAPAVDGFGDPQLSWIIECGGLRIFHAGDTLYHGLWWKIFHRFGPINIAFLPINAPVVDFPPLRPMSSIEAVMNPEQAAVAANILRADFVVPMHYGTMHQPPVYVETPNAVERLGISLTNLDPGIMIKEPGDWFELLK
ncbi:MBL fold metallo-hydrolase [Chryseobacterium paridis]|uniref:MBL fold metallo-hydrolase n=1 Tax=Chryseobacterium paridis TaxID=2800328 RepID=A0ABS1FUR7_9FLAO|nr:MBL fold metallo-hydrolase [Chryseobacterium paridis]MBK1896157.1 MBL fold metallo-hydrolase [Chryseobacterium paridis]